jgi:hypothetical protein
MELCDVTPQIDVCLSVLTEPWQNPDRRYDVLLSDLIPCWQNSEQSYINCKYTILICTKYLRQASWSSGQSFWLLIMRFRVRFPVLPWGFFLEGEDPHGDHGLGSLVESRFKAPPGTSYSYITIHLIGTK